MSATFPVLKTPRLRLRAFASADIPHLVALANDYEVAGKTLNIPHPYTEADAHHWLQLTQQGYEQQTAYCFALELRATGEFIGGMGLAVEHRFDRAEVGYWLGRPYWGLGLATEALEAVLHFGFEVLKINKLHAIHTAGNLALGCVMQKNGKMKEGKLLQYTRRDGQYYNLWQYSLFSAEYAQLSRSENSHFLK